MTEQESTRDMLTNFGGCLVAIALAIAAWVVVCMVLGLSLRVVLVWAGLVP